MRSGRGSSRYFLTGHRSGVAGGEITGEVIDAIAFKFQTGTQWMYLPEKYGNWRGVYNRLRMWAADGTWERVFTALMAQADEEDGLDWVVSVDSTIVRAHQHAAGARKKGPRQANRPTMPSAGPAEG
ncbi:hypothetical protein SMICM17S_11944 [Streptomyces microflavus]